MWSVMHKADCFVRQCCLSLKMWAVYMTLMTNQDHFRTNQKYLAIKRRFDCPLRSVRCICALPSACIDRLCHMIVQIVCSVGLDLTIDTDCCDNGAFVLYGHFERGKWCVLYKLSTPRFATTRLVTNAA